MVLFLVSLLPAGEGSEVNEAYIKKMVDWPGGLLGLSAAAAGLRFATWMTLIAAVRVFEDARQFQGLLGRAVQQLLVNWENTKGVRAP